MTLLKKLLYLFIASLLLLPSIAFGEPAIFGGSGYTDAEIEALISDTAYNATSWDGVTTIAPSKNAVRDAIEALGGGGDVTGITAGDGIRVDNPDTATPDVHIDFDENTTNLESTAIATTDVLLYMNSDDSDDMARGLVSDLPFQAQDDELDDIAGLTFADDKIILGTGAGTIAMADCTAFAQSILDDTDEATFKETVNLEAGTDFQAVVTEGSLTDGVVVNADVKAGTLASDRLVTAIRRTTQAATLDDAGVLTPTAGYWYNEIKITGNDNPTSFTLSEASASDGQVIIIENASANPLTMIDVAGQQELKASITLAITETITFKYSTDSWKETGRATNALGFKTITTTETEYIPISYAVDGASPPDALETITSDTDKTDVRTFQPAADEDVLITWQMPQDIDATSGIKYRVIMFVTHATGPNSEVVQFEMAGFSLGDGDPLNGTIPGSPPTSTLAASSHIQYDRVATAWSSALTSTHITDLSVDGETIIFKLNRDSGVASDYEQVIGVAGIDLKYKRLHDTTF